jgi:shikimate 5-dehydrogenase
MTRGIQLKQLSARNLDYLGLSADLLSAASADRADGGSPIATGQGGAGGGLSVSELSALDGALTAVARQARRGESASAELRALTHEVRECLEATLSLLTEALPAVSRPVARHAWGQYAAARQPHAQYATPAEQAPAQPAEVQVPNAIRVR